MLINKSATIEDIRASARKSTLSMAESAWLRLRDGRTNLEELVRMLPYDAVVDFRQQALWKAKRLSVAVRKHAGFGSPQGLRYRIGPIATLH